MVKTVFRVLGDLLMSYPALADSEYQQFKNVVEIWDPPH